MDIQIGKQLSETPKPVPVEVRSEVILDGKTVGELIDYGVTTCWSRRYMVRIDFRFSQQPYDAHCVSGHGNSLKECINETRRVLKLRMADYTEFLAKLEPETVQA